MPSVAPPVATIAVRPSADPPWQLLREANLLMRERWGAAQVRYGLSFSDYMVLDVCARGPAKTSEVARVAGVTAAGATDLIDRLVARRFVRRAPDPSDRRVIRVHLAPAGERVVRQVRSTKEAAIRFLERAMSPPEQRALAAGLAALIRALREGPRPVGGEGA